MLLPRLGPRDFAPRRGAEGAQLSRGLSAMSGTQGTGAGAAVAQPVADATVGPHLGGTYRLIKAVGEGAYGVV